MSRQPGLSSPSNGRNPSNKYLSFPDGKAGYRVRSPSYAGSRFVFLLTDTGSLMTVSPASKTFALNTPGDPFPDRSDSRCLPHLPVPSARTGRSWTRFPRVPGDSVKEPSGSNKISLGSKRFIRPERKMFSYFPMRHLPDTPEEKVDSHSIII